MLGWEQMGKLLHAYDGHTPLPVCGDEQARRAVDDPSPRTAYVGPMPPPIDMICRACKMYERDHDPMFQLGREHERGVIRQALSREANRIFRSQDKDYPSNVLDTLSFNLMLGDYENLSVRK